ncbi:MAG: biosynthetic-type acetolactate synthase large subunit [Oscillospiraceae bacterium]|nr:biosynthetic-type acetolactate synthase large subunit [Oscillospiraceae bacterium]
MDNPKQLTGAQIVIEQLCLHGVTTVFGYPGGTVLPIYDALYQNSHRIDHVLTAHEQGAAHAADGFARASGKTGVVIATSGPGATNLVTGIANAYLDSVPLVAITGNVPVPLLGKDSFQEVDIVGVTQPIVKHNFVIRDVTQLERTLRKAFLIAQSGRPGPVLVDIPKNIQEATCEYHGIAPEHDKTPAPKFDITDALEAIKACKQPYIYAGGGVIAAGAEAELRQLSERLSAPVGLSMMGLSALPNDYWLNLGMCGMHGKYASSMAQAECDLMIALGVRFSDRATGNVQVYRQGHTIIHIDIDMAEFGKNVNPHLQLHGDVKAVLTALLSVLPEQKNEQWLARVAQMKLDGEIVQTGQLTPQQVFAAVRDVCDDSTVVATDVGQHQMWTTMYYPLAKPRTLLTSGGLGTMGFGMGAAIGGCMATGKQRTILFTGDGSFGMNLNELATAVSQNLPLVILILNNGVLGMVRQWQTRFYDKRYSQTTLQRKTDFPALAKAFGAEGYLAETLPQLQEILANLPDGPVVIDCRIDIDEEVLPMIPPGKTVADIITKR